MCLCACLQGTVDNTDEMVQWNRVPDVSGTTTMRIGSYEQVSTMYTLSNHTLA